MKVKVLQRDRDAAAAPFLIPFTLHNNRHALTPIRKCCWYYCIKCRIKIAYRARSFWDELRQIEERKKVVEWKESVYMCVFFLLLVSFVLKLWFEADDVLCKCCFGDVLLCFMDCKSFSVILGQFDGRKRHFFFRSETWPSEQLSCNRAHFQSVTVKSCA